MRIIVSQAEVFKAEHPMQLASLTKSINQMTHAWACSHCDSKGWCMPNVNYCNKCGRQMRAWLMNDIERLNAHYSEVTH